MSSFDNNEYTPINQENNDEAQHLNDLLVQNGFLSTDQENNEDYPPVDQENVEDNQPIEDQENSEDNQEIAEDGDSLQCYPPSINQENAEDNPQINHENTEDYPQINYENVDTYTPLNQEINEYTPLNQEASCSSFNYLTVNNEQNEETLSIYNETDLLFIVKDSSKSNTTKDRIGHMLNTKNWNIAILLMIACDVLIVVLELFIQLDEKRQCPQNPSSNDIVDDDKFVTFVHKLGYLSDAFLYIFTAEFLLHVYCFGVKYIFEEWINFIDSLTVMITFALTIFFTFWAVNDTAQNFVDILIILRFWRIFCLVESVVNATQMEANLRFKDVLIDLNAEVRILENRKNCYAEKLTELGYNLSELENEYLFPKIENPKIRKEGTTSKKIDEIVLNVSNDVNKAK